jgi:hypothetical protein
MRIDRRKWIKTDGTENEFIRVDDRNLNNPEATEQLGRDLLQAAAEWRAEIEARGPPGAPAYKVFEFTSWNGHPHRVASWIEQPWALVRLGKGTAVAFLVKEEQVFAGRRYRGWIVSAKIENGRHHWKCRFEGTSTVETRDLIQIFRYALPDSPTLGDIESAREKARALVEAVS